MRTVNYYYDGSKLVREREGFTETVYPWSEDYALAIEFAERVAEEEQADYDEWAAEQQAAYDDAWGPGIDMPGGYGS